MKEVAGRIESHPLGIDLESDTASLSSSMSRDDLRKVASSLGDLTAAGAETDAVPQAPMQLQASLGELALFISGRPCEVWWPPEVLHTKAFLHCAITSICKPSPSIVSCCRQSSLILGNARCCVKHCAL